MNDASQPDIAGLLRDILQQQTAMLQVQAESVRLQRALVERLLGASGPPREPAVAASIRPATAAGPGLTDLTTASASSVAPVATTLLETTKRSPIEPAPEQAPGSNPLEAESDLPFAPAPAEQSPARGARYYQPRPSPAARIIAPHELELMRRLQVRRESSDLILQFGPYKGSTLAQVAMSNPDYIRQLMRSAQRPEVRAAAGRLVQALDAAAEHKPKTRGTARRGRPAR